MCAKKKKHVNGIVYSTNPDFIYDDNAIEEPDTLSPAQQDLRITLDKKQRGGKKVTLISGFVGKTDDLKALANILKKRCGTGGTAKDGVILIQGDFREPVLKFLQENSYQVKRSGG